VREVKRERGQERDREGDRERGGPYRRVCGLEVSEFIACLEGPEGREKDERSEGGVGDHGRAELSGSLTVEARKAMVLFQDTSSQSVPAVAKQGQE
jgi:hypothetical protein